MKENRNETLQYIERISALHRSWMRKFAQDEGLQMVQIEIVQYLATCNRYSDTTQALSDYLGRLKAAFRRVFRILRRLVFYDEIKIRMTSESSIFS